MKNLISMLMAMSFTIGLASGNDAIFQRLEESFGYHFAENQLEDASASLSAYLYYQKRFDTNSDKLAELQRLLEAKIDEASPVSVSFIEDNKYYPVKNWNGKYGFVEMTGEQIIEPKYDYLEPFSNGLSLATIDNEHFFIDYAGNIILQEQDTTDLKIAFKESFSDGRAKCYIESFSRGWKGDGFINLEGEIVIPPIKNYKMESFSEGYALVGIDYSFGFIDINGDWFIEPSFFDARSFQDGMAAVKYERRGNWGYIDTSGASLRPIFNGRNEPGKFSEGLVSGYHYQEGLCYVDKSGQIIIDLKDDLNIVSRGFSHANAEFHEGLAGILDTTSGSQIPTFIDKSGRVVFTIPPIKSNSGMFSWYSSFNHFSNGLAAISMDFKGWGYIDQSGEIILGPNKSIGLFLQKFINGYAIIKDFDSNDTFILSTEGAMNQVN